MKTAHVVLALVAVGLPAGALAYSRRKSAAPLPPQAPPPQLEPAALGALVPEPDPGPVGVLASELPPGGPLNGGDLLVEGAKKLLGSTVGATIELGLKSLELQENLVTALGANEATRDAVRVFGHTATVGFAVQQGLEKVADVVGIDRETAKDIGQVGGIATVAGAVLGAPAVLGVVVVKGAAELASAAIGAIAGEEAERAVRGFVSEADPFRTGSAANQLIASVGNAIFGERPKAPPPPPPPLTPEELERIRIQGENSERAAAVARAAAARTINIKGKSGNKGLQFQED